MAESFGQTGDDVKRLADVNEFEDPDLSLSEHVELYQLISLQKAVDEAKSGIGAIVKPLVDEEVKYLMAAATALASSKELQEKYGRGMSGIKKLANMMFKRAAERTAKRDLDKFIKDTGVERKSVLHP